MEVMIYGTRTGNFMAIITAWGWSIVTLCTVIVCGSQMGIMPALPILRTVTLVTLVIWFNHGMAACGMTGNTLCRTATDRALNIGIPTGMAGITVVQVLGANRVTTVMTA